MREKYKLTDAQWDKIADIFPKRKKMGRPPIDRGEMWWKDVVGWLKELRRIATRYEKLATHYLGMIFRYL